MKKSSLILTLAAFSLFYTQIANAEIVIEKLEDPPYLNPDGSTYVVETPKTKDSPRTVTTYTPLKTDGGFKNALSSAHLSKIERKVFNRNFVGDTIYNRLSRLERRVFGAAQRGDSDNRLKRLAVATKSYTNNYAENYAMENGYGNDYSPKNWQKKYNQFYNKKDSKQNAITSNYSDPYNMYAPFQPYKRTGLKEFFKIFTGGIVTGYTPPATTTVGNVQNYGNNGYNGAYGTPNNIYYDPNANINTYGYNHFGPNNYQTYQRNYQNPYQNQYYTPGVPNGGLAGSSNPNRIDLFSNGASGSEMYYDDGQYKKSLNSTSGGCGVKIIY